MKDGDCTPILEQLSEYLDHRLAPATCEQLEAHLRECPECIEFFRSLKHSMGLCRQLGNCQAAAEFAPEAMASLRRAYREMLARRRKSTASQD